MDQPTSSAWTLQLPTHNGSTTFSHHPLRLPTRSTQTNNITLHENDPPHHIVKEVFAELPISVAPGVVLYENPVVGQPPLIKSSISHLQIQKTSFFPLPIGLEAVVKKESGWRSMVNRLCSCLGLGGRVADSSGASDIQASGSQEAGKKVFTTNSGATNHRRGSGEEVKEKQRVLRANDREFNMAFDYADNYIKTSKYNLATFFPVNIIEQFGRLANFYFLVLMLLQFIPEISSVAWFSTAIPLSIVLSISACKDGYDDYQRHQSDKQVNNRTAYIVRNGRLEEETWMNVKVGDIVRMENEHFIAADLLLLSSSEPHGLCYIETAELDGETNLKTRAALPETSSMGDIVKDISAFNGEIYCEAPNNRLDRFEGRLVYKGKKLALDNNKLLLRGCRLRNTRWCYGLVVFAGRDTKLMMNSGKTMLKRTSLDRFLNILIMGIVLFLFAMCFICAILSGVWENVTGQYFRVYLPWDVLVETVSYKKSKVFFIAFLQLFSYIILLNTVVPISLYISVEVIRLGHSWWINFDRKMYYDKTDTSAKARTTTLNEELGQVQYVFSDKTGTLTQNIMIFKKCSINGRSYGDLMSERGEMLDIDEHTKFLDFSVISRWHEPAFRFYDKTLVDDTKKGVPEVQEFWRLLAICHTVMPERKTGNQLEYQAQSPDEAALTSAARNFGFVFKSRTPRSVTVEVNGKEEVYEVLHILDFDNVRKRMSVIVRGGPKNDVSSRRNVKLYCKGADTMILERLSKENTSELLKAATLQHLDKFASDGLRTLCVAYKQIDPDYCIRWMERQQEAALDIANKDARLDELYEEIEKDMILIGATAIEDKLQDGVPKCIAALSAANIKLWVLTGDKTETAINIGYSCHLLTEDMKEVFIIDGKEEGEVEVQLKDIKRRIERTSTTQNTVIGGSDFYLPPKKPVPPTINIARISASNPPEMENGFVSYPHSLSVPGSADGYFKGKSNGLNQPVIQEDSLPPQEGYALVINGDSLVHALKKKYEKLFLEIGCLCISVICCRVTPLQKAKVVELVKQNIKAVTLAIGDGANDVSMIKTADIGVGISGQEGMQAVLSSDYSIGQFRYLERLLLVHGRWSYFRMSKFLRYFFYKNFSYTLTHFWYSFFCGYSAQSVYDPIMIACYNMLFTSLPVLAMGVFDQDVSDEYSLQYPKLYIPGQYNLFFNMRIFIYSIIHGMISSIVLFFIPYGAFYHAIDSSGRDMSDYPLLCFTTFTALVIVVNGQIMFDTSYWTFFNFLVIFGSIFFYFAVAIIFYEFIPTSLLYYLPSVVESYNVAFRAFSSPQFWLSLALICVILLVPTMANRFFWFDTRPSYAERLRVRYKLQPEEERKPQGSQPASIIKPLVTRTAVTRRSGRRGSLRSGYAFSHSQGFGELIAKGTLFKNIEHLRIPSFHRGNSPRRMSTKTAPAIDLSPIVEQHAQLSAGPSSTSTYIYSPHSSATQLPGSSYRKSKSPKEIDSRGTNHSSDDNALSFSPRDNDPARAMSPTRAVPVLCGSSCTPSPTFDSTHHNLVVNIDDDPLPSNWQLHTDGTMEIGELEHPPAPGTQPFSVYTQAQETITSKKPSSSKFVTKKRRPTEASLGRLESLTSTTTNANNTNINAKAKHNVKYGIKNPGTQAPRKIDGQEDRSTRFPSSNGPNRIKKDKETEELEGDPSSSNPKTSKSTKKNIKKK